MGLCPVPGTGLSGEGLRKQTMQTDSLSPCAISDSLSENTPARQVTPSGVSPGGFIPRCVALASLLNLSVP